MTRIPRLISRHVEYIPDKLDPGILYVSRRYSTASHICCCGCGQEIVTPLKAAKWSLTERGGAPTLTPSIGNWSLPCRSHYLIIDGRVVWARQMSAKQIAAVQSQDLLDAVAVHQRNRKRLFYWIATAAVGAKDAVVRIWRSLK